MDRLDRFHFNQMSLWVLSGVACLVFSGCSFSIKPSANANHGSTGTAASSTPTPTSTPVSAATPTPTSPPTPGTIALFAGRYTTLYQGYAGDGGPANAAAVNVPRKGVVDSSGNVYILDSNNDMVRMVPKNSGNHFGISMVGGSIYNVAGSGGSGGPSGDNGIATSAQFNPTGLAVDSTGNLYIADFSNLAIRMVPAVSGTYFGISMTAGNIYTVVGSGVQGNSGDGGAATSAQISPYGVALDSLGGIYIINNYLTNSTIRMVPAVSGTYFGAPMTAGSIYTIVGDGTQAFAGDGGPALSAEINVPDSIALDSSNNLFISDSTNHVIRMVPQATGSYFGVSMTANYIYSIAGTGGTSGYTGDGGLATAATFNHPTGIAFDTAGNLYVADYSNYVERVIAKVTGTILGQSVTANHIYTVVGNGTSGYTGDGGSAISAELKNPTGTAVSSTGTVYIFDQGASAVRMVSSNGTIQTFAGLNPMAGDGGVASSAAMNGPGNIAYDSAGNMYIADLSNHLVRMIPKSSGTNFGISMVAGNLYTIVGQPGVSGNTGDSGNPTSATITAPRIAVDAAGDLWIGSGVVVRFIPKSSGTYYGNSLSAGTIYTVAGSGATGFLGNGGIATGARMKSKAAITVDASLNLYIADSQNNTIRMVPNTSGTHFGVSMTAGFIYGLTSTGAGFTGDGGIATSAKTSGPSGIAVDASGNLYISDTNNHAIRMLPVSSGTYFGISMTANHLYTIAGTLGSTGSSGDHGLATSALMTSPQGITVDGAGNIYFGDGGANVLRMIAATSGTAFGQSFSANNIYTLVGISGTGGYTGNGGASTSAEMLSSYGIAFDLNNNLYFSDTGNNVIREIFH